MSSSNSSATPRSACWPLRALFRRFPNQREGELTRLRASVISRKHLGEVGVRLEASANGCAWAAPQSVTPAATTPRCSPTSSRRLIAALYLDGGLDVAARAFVEREVLANALPETAPTLAPGEQFSSKVGDHKSALQEMLQAQGRRKPEYRLVEESGPDHKRLFRVEVWLEGETSHLRSCRHHQETGSATRRATRRQPACWRSREAAR